MEKRAKRLEIPRFFTILFLIRQTETEASYGKDYFTEYIYPVSSGSFVVAVDVAAPQIFPGAAVSGCGDRPHHGRRAGDLVQAAQASFDDDDSLCKV